MQLLAAGLGKPIEACPAVLFRSAPLGSYRAFILQLQQQGIERALVHVQKISANLLDAPGDTPAVLRPQDIESLKHHQGERSLQDVRLFLHQRVLPLGSQQEEWHASCWKATGNLRLSFDDKSKKSCRETAGALAFCKINARGLATSR